MSSFTVLLTWIDSSMIVLLKYWLLFWWYDGNRVVEREKIGILPSIQYNHRNTPQRANPQLGHADIKRSTQYGRSLDAIASLKEPFVTHGIMVCQTASSLQSLQLDSQSIQTIENCYFLVCEAWESWNITHLATWMNSFYKSVLWQFRLGSLTPTNIS